MTTQQKDNMMANLVTGNSGTRPVDYAQPQHREKEFSLHPEVQRATMEFANAIQERDELRLENETLRNQVKVQDAHIAELQHQHDDEKNKKERYQRYCTVVQTLIHSISLAAEQAHAAAKDHAMVEPPPKLTASNSAANSASKLEQEVADVAKQLRQQT